jgi:hypothetical protein
VVATAWCQSGVVPPRGGGAEPSILSST